MVNRESMKALAEKNRFYNIDYIKQMIYDAALGGMLVNTA